MEHRNLASFKTVAETGSFSKAAEKLGYAQSTITFQIKQLEEELGVLLFDRIGNHISLTDAGHTLLDYSTRILSLEYEAKNRIIKDDTPSGIIKIASIDSLCANLLPLLIREFSELYPAVTISASSVTKSDVLGSIANGSADIGFYMDFNPPADNFITILHIESSLSFLCSPTHKAYRKEPVRISELSSVPMIVTEKSCTYRTLLQQIFAQNNTEMSVYFESENTEVIKHFAEAGIGVAFLPEIAVSEELKEQKLCRLPVDVKIPPAYIHAIHHKSKWLTPAVREFCKLLENKFVNL